MSELYCSDKLSCPYKEKGRHSTIELLVLNQNELIDNSSLNDKMVFLVKGKVSLSFASHSGSIIGAGKAVYMPVNQHYCVRALEGSTLLIIRLQEQITFCNCMSIEDLARFFENDNYQDLDDLYLLDINPQIKGYVEFMLACIDQGIYCGIFYRNKVKELFFLLRAFYSQRDLSLFFRKALSADSVFSSYVMRNSHNYKSVSELAQALNYSVSGFEKHFKRIFGVSPYKWMLHNKADKVYYEIRHERRSFKDICDEFGFSSISHFTNFCKTYLGDTPSNIRKYGKIWENRCESNYHGN
ncbi:AraC-like DNA-binding protein [Dysgonomonas hofstadii]|uniref:AraC-like DNA-binding protein n=1 Tax=Dysgonomonas hofstadii TaxID=637886 RepID=A0A840CW20_9BACT|nr:AraC family transcriptional regulator [Dysgonomonas hofstadii]MBB4038368.1 AraC-like DNA-binding protein [Dysgonomonas hofstadii]